MKNKKDKLIESISLYLRENKLDNDSEIYSIEDWQKRDEDYLNDCEFVIISEGGLNFILNYGDSDEFYELIDSFGFFMEMGHSWSYGFYIDEERQENNILTNVTYSEKLRDERWQRKRDKVKEKANYKCQDCGNKEKLEVHHCYYKYGLEPWQYPIDSLRCLCSGCHEKRGKVEMVLRARMADLNTKELEAISEFIYGGMNYYPENKILDFIQSLDLNISQLKIEQTDNKK